MAVRHEEVAYGAALALARTEGLLRKGAARFFRKFDLSQSQFNVLRLLHDEAPKGISQIEIARQLLVRGANTSVLVRRLEANELISREVDSNDERARVVRITAKGRRLLKRIEPSYSSKVHQLMEGLSYRELQQFISLLDLCHENIEEMEDIW